MRRDLQHLMDAMETGARAIAEKHFSHNTNNDEHIGSMHLGNEHISLPSLLIADPVLEMVDKGIYCTIRLLTPKGVTNSNMAYPSYDHICKIANVGSHATVARALAILRITRWLTCKQVTSSRGVVANVYITHDHPLDIIDMETLDDGYMAYVTSCLSHHHNRVSQVAQTILTQYENDLINGKDLSRATHHLENIVDANAFINGNEEATYFGLGSEAIRHLRKTRYTKSSSLNIKEPERIRSLKFKEHQKANLSSKIKEPEKLTSSNIEEPDKFSSLNIEEPSSSCSSLNITTTTTKNQAFYISVNADEALKQLIKERFSTLKPEQHYRIGRLLMRINPEDREPMIFEVSNRIRFGNKAIPNPVGYIGRLCGLLKKGEYPFSDFSLSDYQQHEEPAYKQLSPKKRANNELASINSELSRCWADLKSLERLQESASNDVVEKSLEKTRKRLKELSYKKTQLEKNTENISFNRVVHRGPP